MNIPIPTKTQDIFSYGFNKGLYRIPLYSETEIDSVDSKEKFNLESDIVVGGVFRTVAQGGRLEITSENVRTIVFYDSEDEMESMIQSDSNPNLPGIDITAVNNKEYLIDPSLENWATTTNLTYWTEDGVSGGTRDIDKESTEITSYFPPVSIYSAKLTAVGNDGTDFGIYQDFSWGDDMATDYIFSCNYKIASKTAGKIKIEAYDQDNSISLGTAESTTTGSWEILRAKFSTSNTNITIRFKVYFENETNGVTYIDNISVKVMGSMIRLDNNWAYMATDKFEVYGKYATEAFQFLCDGLANTYSFNFSADNVADLGTSTYQFKDLYIDGIAYIDDIRLDIAQIGGATNYINIAAGGILTMQGSATIDGIGSGNLVDKSTTESISGVWTFSSFPLTPSSAPINDYDVANKKFVDDSVVGTGDFGSGYDGDLTTSGNITLTRDMYYNDLTVGHTISTGGCKIFVKGTLTINNGGIVHRNGESGSTGGDGGNGASDAGGTAGAGGAGGTALTGGTTPDSAAGTNGTAGNVGRHLEGITGGSTTNGTTGNNGSNGANQAKSLGTVGATGNTSANDVWSESVEVGITGSESYLADHGRGGSAAGTGGSKTGTIYAIPYGTISAYNLQERDGTNFTSSTGAGTNANCSEGAVALKAQYAASYASSGGSGGMGGCGAVGGFTVIFAKTVVINSGGKIQSNGGNGDPGGTGGNGATNIVTTNGGAAAGASRGGAGGNGGNGGVIIIVYKSLTNNGTIEVAGGTGGAGGAHGNGHTQAKGTNYYATLQGDESGNEPTGVSGAVGSIYYIQI